MYGLLSRSALEIGNWFVSSTPEGVSVINFECPSTQRIALLREDRVTHLTYGRARARGTEGPLHWAVR